MSNLVIMTSSDLEDSRQSRLDVLYPIICPTIGWVFKIGNFKHTLLKDRKLIQKKKKT